MKNPQIEVKKHKERKFGKNKKEIRKKLYN